MTPDRWGYRVWGHPEFGTEFHHVGTILETLAAIDQHELHRKADHTLGPATMVHEDEFL